MNLESRKAGKELIVWKKARRYFADSYFVSCFPAFQIQEISSILG